MGSEQLSNAIQIRAYSADGYEILFTLPAADLSAAATQLAQVRAAGYLAYQPQPAEGERQTIMSVMRHVSDSGTPIIAAYPAWKYEGKYGEYKFASIYMDSPADIAQFEAQSGLKLDDIPLSDGEAGVRRRYGKTIPKEVAVRRPFEMFRVPDGTADDGKPRYRYDYAARLPLPDARPSWTPEQVKTFIARWESDNLTQADLIRALKISRWGDWKGTTDEAHAAVSAYIEANLFGDSVTPATNGALADASH